MADGYCKVHGYGFAFLSVFADIGQTYVFICVIAASAITLGWGLYLVKDNKGTNKKKKGK